MRHHHLLALAGCALVALGFTAGHWTLLAAWLGANVLALAAAHRGGVHRLYGKRPDGTLPWWSRLVFLPLLSYTHAIWHLVRALHPDPAYSIVTDQLVVGRRLRATEFDFACENYVDLTAEFTEPAAIRRHPAYRSVPILDFSAPSPEALRTAVLGLRPGRTFVHCAQGHGRAALFALAVLLRYGTVRTVDEGWAMLRTARPGVRLTKEQRECIESYATQNVVAAGQCGAGAAGVGGSG